MSSAPPKTSHYVVLTGNPNCGKTTLFNALTDLRAKVGNYAGVTVERKEGRLLGAPSDLEIKVLDLPGTYSLSPQSLDEQISRDVLLNRLPIGPESFFSQGRFPDGVIRARRNLGLKRAGNSAQASALGVACDGQARMKARSAAHRAGGVGMRVVLFCVLLAVSVAIV